MDPDWDGPIGWRWDETLFAGTAAYYRRGRVPYAPGFEDALAAALGLDGTGRLLDVGCGPGTLTLALADRFAEAIGLDPDAGMIAEAERAAGAAVAAGEEAAGRVRWIRGLAEDLPGVLAAVPTGAGAPASASIDVDVDVNVDVDVDVVTFGSSFHWMDRRRVAATVRTLLRPGGAVVHVADLKTEAPPPPPPSHPPIPDAAVTALVQRYLGPTRRAGRGTLPHGTPGDEDSVFAATGYPPAEHLIVPGAGHLPRTVDDAMATVFSLSYSAPHLFGADLPAFTADLRSLLTEAAVDGRFWEYQASTHVRIWRRDRD